MPLRPRHGGFPSHHHTGSSRQSPGGSTRSRQRRGFGTFLMAGSEIIPGTKESAMTTKSLTRVQTARDVMRREVITVSARINTLELVRMMNRYDVPGAPVVDDARRLVGVVSRADVRGLLRWELGQEIGGGDSATREVFLDEFFRAPPVGRRLLLPENPSLRKYAVEEIVSAAAFSVAPHTPTAIVGRIIRQASLHRLLVVERGRLEGMITPFDLIFPRSGRSWQ